MKTKLVDPIQLLRAKAAAETAAASVHAPGLAEATHSDVPYELPLVPPAGAKLQRLTIASTYRSPIPVLFDPVTRTTYPLQN